MVVDVRTELARPDYDLAQLLKRGGKPLFLAVNKVETEALGGGGGEFSPAGHPRICFAVSSEHGQGIGELLDAIAEAMPEQQDSESASQRAGDEVDPSSPHPSDKNNSVARTAASHRVRKTRQTTRNRSARTASLSSAKLRWRLSGGRMWARARC